MGKWVKIRVDATVCKFGRVKHQGLFVLLLYICQGERPGRDYLPRYCVTFRRAVYGFSLFISLDVA